MLNAIVIIYNKIKDLFHYLELLDIKHLIIHLIWQQKEVKP